MTKYFHSSAAAILLIALIVCFTGCKSATDKNTYLGVEKSQIETQLNNLLENFYPRIIDTVNGGYWTNFENDWTLSPDQEKMLVTQARGLWTAARAAEIFPDNPTYHLAADQGYEFLTRHMWDSVNGGFYQTYNPNTVQKVDASYKLAYGNAFALYALAQYVKINPDPMALAWVKKTFDWLETALHDSTDLGYFSVFLPKSALITGKSPEEIHYISQGDVFRKDQNTSIHLMEALTTTYQVLPEETVKARLTEMVSLVRDSMTTPQGYLQLFFDRKWQPVSNTGLPREEIMKNIQIDHISFGHNIETAYLLIDAAQALYGKPDNLTLGVAKKLIDHTLAWGFDQDFNGLFDKGYSFIPDSIEVIDSVKVWWAQAEAWHACALFAGFFPEEPVFQEAFSNMWDYLNKELIDPQYGGWYNSGLDKSPSTIRERKAHAWKGCYHDGRALMQVWQYANGKQNQDSDK